MKKQHSGGLTLLAAVFDENGLIVASWNRDYPLLLDEAGYRAFLKSGTYLSMSFAIRKNLDTHQRCKARWVSTRAVWK